MKDKTVVIKYGSASVSDENGMDYNRLQQYAKKLARLSKKYNLVLVCSGAVATGRSVLKEHILGSKKVDLRLLAMLGSARSFLAWQESLLGYGILSGQLLITHREVDDVKEGPSLHAAIEANKAAGIVTIINENDALSVTELAKLSYGGDNDGLAAHIAISLNADAVIMLTNVDGLIDDGKVIKSVSATMLSWSDAMLCVDSSRSRSGRGGMRSKVEAVTRASQQGIDAYIANANADIDEVLKGISGTHFVAKVINE